MADFEIAAALINHNEGGYWKGYTDTYRDPGGETYNGISRVFHPRWPGWVFIDETKKGGGSIQWKTKFPELDYEVRRFYREAFWEPLLLELVNDQGVANSVLDMAANLGAQKAIAKVQMTLNQTWNQVLKVDGVMGPKTIAAINKLPPGELNNSLFKARIRHHLKHADPAIFPALLERCMNGLVG